MDDWKKQFVELRHTLFIQLFKLDRIVGYLVISGKAIKDVDASCTANWDWMLILQPIQQYSSRSDGEWRVVPAMST